MLSKEEEVLQVDRSNYLWLAERENKHVEKGNLTDDKKWCENSSFPVGWTKEQMFARYVVAIGK